MKLIPYEKAVIDKLKIVFHAHDVDRGTAKSITSVLNDMVEEKKARRLSSQGKGYIDRFSILLNKKDGLLVEINPNRPDNTPWAMTWEYTPSHLRKTDRAKLLALARQILGASARELLMGVAVYEIHLAVDFLQDIANVMIESRNKTSCGAWGKTFGTAARLQSQYFGSSKSDHHQIAYDKRAEVLAAYAKRPETKVSQVRARRDDLEPRLRVEDRQRLSRCPVPLHKLQDLREPFAGFHIYSLAVAEAFLKDQVGRLVLALAQASGLQLALHQLDKASRERVRQQLAAAHVDWWDARVYQHAVTAALKATQLFDSQAFTAEGGAGSAVDHWYAGSRERQNQRSTGLNGATGRTADNDYLDEVFGADDEEDGDGDEGDE
ncbi:MAG: hypothetical protein V4795_18820 [Pseudomonadota bacterium]